MVPEQAEFDNALEGVVVKFPGFSIHPDFGMLASPLSKTVQEPLAVTRAFLARRTPAATDLVPEPRVRRLLTVTEHVHCVFDTSVFGVAQTMGAALFCAWH